MSVAFANSRNRVDHDDPTVQPAFITFVAVQIVGAIIYVANGRKVWFFGVFGDEWDFLAGRRASIHDLLLRHGDHLVALPALMFRVLYNVFGLRSYLPYQLVAIGLHLGAAALLRIIMRRARVRPWIATAAASLFVLFGAGSQDILIAFQMTFGGALVLGLTQLLLADHDGPIDRRDAYGLLAGFGALLCSDVAITMVAIVGIACLIRGKWRAAALHTVPLAAVYLAWALAYGRGARTNLHPSHISTSARTSLSASFGALAQVPFGGWVLAAMLVVGLAIALRTDAAPRRHLSAPLALAIGALIFVAMLAVTRFGLDAQFAASSRYLHILAALFLPALAVAADAIARRSRVMGYVVLVLFVIGIPGNIAKTGDNIGPEARYREQQRVISELPRIALARVAPLDLHPTPSFAAEVTVGWLLEAVRDERVPTPFRSTTRDRATDRLRLSLEQFNGTGVTGQEIEGSGLDTCMPLRVPVMRRLAQGESFGVLGAIDVQSVPGAGRPASQPLPFGTSLLATARTHTLRAVVGPLNLRIAPRTKRAALC